MLPWSGVRGRLKRSSCRQPSHHEPNYGDVDQRFRFFRQALIVSLETTMAPQPSEHALDDPAPWNYRKSPLSSWLAYDF